MFYVPLVTKLVVMFAVECINAVNINAIHVLVYQVHYSLVSQIFPSSSPPPPPFPVIFIFFSSFLFLQLLLLQNYHHQYHHHPLLLRFHYHPLILIHILIFTPILISNLPCSNWIMIHGARWRLPTSVFYWFGASGWTPLRQVKVVYPYMVFMVLILFPTPASITSFKRNTGVPWKLIFCVPWFFEG